MYLISYDCITYWTKVMTDLVQRLLWLLMYNLLKQTTKIRTIWFIFKKIPDLFFKWIVSLLLYLSSEYIQKTLILQDRSEHKGEKGYYITNNLWCLFNLYYIWKFGEYFKWFCQDNGHFYNGNRIPLSQASLFSWNESDSTLYSPYKFFLSPANVFRISFE